MTKSDKTINLGVIFILSKNLKTLLYATGAAAGMFIASTQATHAATTVDIQKGDTIWAFSQKYGVSISDIEKANNVDSATHLIYSGNKIVIPDATDVASQDATSQAPASQAVESQAAVDDQASIGAANQAAAQAEAQASAEAASAQAAQEAAAQASAEAASAQAAQEAAAQAQASAAQATQQQTQTAPVNNYASSQATTPSNNSSYTSSLSGSEAAAQAWIANKESGGSYTASNGSYYGKYQLSASYLNGDYSAANQEAVANSYVTSRYGSWVNAQSHWLTYGWY